MKRWTGLALAAVGLGAAGARALLRERNRIDMIDPATLVIEQAEVMAERFPPIEGVVNFRDVGGYRTSSGQRVRMGLVYRSGALHHLTAADLAVVDGLGIKLVCDLRSAEERHAEPDVLPAGAQYVHLPLEAEDQRRQQLMAVLFHRRKLPLILQEFYVNVIVERNARLYGGLLRRLTEAEQLPTVIHCTAGKDRTGFAVALLLGVLGVEEETIIADYALSNRFYERLLTLGRRAVEPLKRFRIQAEDLQPLWMADPANLRAALAHIHKTYGSVEGYARTAAGLDDDTLNRLRTLLLED